MSVGTEVIEGTQNRAPLTPLPRSLDLSLILYSSIVREIRLPRRTLLWTPTLSRYTETSWCSSSFTTIQTTRRIFHIHHLTRLPLRDLSLFVLGPE